MAKKLKRIASSGRVGTRSWIRKTSQQGKCSSEEEMNLQLFQIPVFINKVSCAHALIDGGCQSYGMMSSSCASRTQTSPHPNQTQERHPGL